MARILQVWAGLNSPCRLCGQDKRASWKKGGRPQQCESLYRQISLDPYIYIFVLHWHHNNLVIRSSVAEPLRVRCWREQRDTSTLTSSQHWWDAGPQRYSGIFQIRHLACVGHFGPRPGSAVYVKPIKINNQSGRREARQREINMRLVHIVSFKIISLICWGENCLLDCLCDNENGPCAFFFSPHSTFSIFGFSELEIKGTDW